MPTFSVIVPVFNTAPLLARCLDSVLSQTDADLEIIAVDDGSTDESLSLLKKYQSKDARVTVFHQENAGLSAARNAGLERANGEYVAFLDSDDWIERSFLARMRAAIEREGADLVLCDFDYVYDSGKAVPASSARLKGADLVRTLLVAAPMAPLRVAKKEIAAAFPFPAGILYEDLATTALYLLKAQRATYLPEVLYHYYQRPGSIMHQNVFQEKFWDIERALDRVYTAYKEEGKLEACRAEVEYLFIEHLLRSAALRFAAADGGKEAFGRLPACVAARFPAWKQNPYLKQTSLFFRLVVNLTARGRYRAVRFLERRIHG